MSFTIKVKEEIIAASSKDKAELSALIKMSGSVGLTNQGLTLSISTENAKIARHIYQLMESRYQSNPELRHHNKTNLKKNRVYTVFVAGHVNDILSDLQLADSFFGFETGIETSVMEDDEAGRSYLRGAFLATGATMNADQVVYTDCHATYRIDLSILGRPSRTCLLKCDIRGTTLHMSEIQMRPDKGSSS